MKMGAASGLQIAFLIFAIALLAVPLSNHLGSLLPWTSDQKADLGRVFPFLLFALLLVLFPALRHRCVKELSAPIPSGKKREVFLVGIAKLALPLAFAGGLGLWISWTGGADALEHRLLAEGRYEARMAEALAAPAVIRQILFATIMAPICEELVFRGFLYRAWEREWGWFPAMLMTSTVFGFYHSYFVSAFFGSIVFVCALRRAGTIWAPIAVHALFNLALWYPLLGQFMFPKGSEAQRDLSLWKLQLICLALATIAIPAYVWLARKPYRKEAAPSP